MLLTGRTGDRWDQRIRGTLIPALLLFLAGCGESDPAAGGGKKSAPTSLPRMRASRILPLKEKQNLWRYDGRSFEYKDTSVPSGEPYPDDEAAVNAGKEFLREHFGPLTDQIRAKDVTPSASGQGKAKDSDDLGHTITLEFWHDGFQLEGPFAVIYLKGKQVRSASVSLFSVQTISGSEKILISEKEALKIFSESVEKGFGKKYAIADKIEIRYCGSPEYKTSSDGKSFMLRPFWFITFSHSTELIVDPLTGELWRNG